MSDSIKSMCDESCDHPPKGYYIRMGFSEKMADRIIEGFHF